MQHDDFVPAFVVDVTASWPAKMAALDAYGSRSPGPARPGWRRPPTKVDRSEPATKVASREFRLAVEGRARHYGNLIGAELGEPFGSVTLLAVADPWDTSPARSAIKTLRIGISCYPTFGGSGDRRDRARDGARRRAATRSTSSATRCRRGLALVDPRLFFHEVVIPHYPLFEYPPWSLALASKIAEVARFQGLDLVHVHYAVPNAVSAILAREIVAPRPLPVVTTLHGTDVTLVGNDPSYLETTRWALISSDAVTAVSEWLKQKTVEQLCVEETPIEVIPNFIEPERFEAVRHLPGARRWAKPARRSSSTSRTSARSSG